MVASYRMMDGQAGRPGIGSTGTQPPAAVAATSGGWLLGTIFSVSGQVGWLEGYWHWVPPNGDTTPRKFATWNRYSNTQQVVVPGSVVTSGPLTAGQFNFVPLAPQVPLSPGALYVGAAGWTVPNGSGIPVSGNQFGNGGPYSNGISNGILTGWSSLSGSNKFPAAAGNYNLGQGLFSNALGADPSLAMPNNGSGDDILWVDVQVGDTAPAGYAGSYRFHPKMTDLGNYSLDTANGFTLGKQFSVSQRCTVDAGWFYSPVEVSKLPDAIGVYRISDQALVGVNASPSWSGAAGSGWISAPMPGVTLQPGTGYKYVVFQGSNVIWNAAVAGYYSTGFGAAGLASGPLFAPNFAGAAPLGQESYHQGSSIAFPDTNAGPFAYGLDIAVTVASSAPTVLMAAGLS